MCWSMKSSFTFSCLGFIMTMDQLRRLPSAKSKVAQLSQVFLYLTYALMEALQFFQYYYGLVDSCNSESNKNLTIVAHFLVWIQPLVQNYWCLNHTLKSRSVFRFAIVASLICLIISTIALYMGYNQMMGHGPNTNHMSANELLTKFGTSPKSVEITSDGYGTESRVNNIPIQNVGSSMCSYQGPNHLYWMFPYHQLWGYLPHWGTWLLITVLPHFFRVHDDKDWFISNRVLGIGVLSGWLISLVVSVSIGVFHEIWSYWCLISVPYLVLPYLYKWIWRGLLGWKHPDHAFINVQQKKKN
ncbi:predicted protein [Naegleria gruberi]|uniref:Predicted protein n=1 Tax=Naegleria gruberi TaxID=5762 RepID=D2VII1_NAEGR|nr:uncharacterized protein NAEGRDRAFT_68690 [Naegleria gruberi]EFC43364.1 predicted protein [Naegleria gruberi]|eukprot:XP_002676108.1 predicted protein [Naegleria gruberi strain NEG-M]